VGLREKYLFFKLRKEVPLSASKGTGLEERQRKVRTLVYASAITRIEKASQ
jgi:hypothetical protein